MGRRAFSLIEVMIVCLLGLALGGVILALFFQVTSSGRLGEGRLGNQLRARQAMRRVIPWIRFSTAPNTSQSGIYAPDTNITATNVVFAVPEDPLAVAPATFDPRSPSYFLMQIRYSPTNSSLILEDFYSPTRYQLLATDIAAFNVTRTHKLGVTVRIRTEAQVRDVRGNSRGVDYQIEESLEVPE